MSLSEIIQEARRTGDFTALTRAVPYLEFLGIQIARVEGELISTLTFSDMLVGRPMPAILHGGTVGGLLENAALFELVCAENIAALPKTIHFTTEYLRPGRPQDVYARAIVTKLGRRVANVRTVAWQTDEAKPIATGHGHFLIA